MTSFVQKQERLFREAGDGDLVPLRSVGRIKDYTSCTDRRAWVTNDEPRRQYILEMIKSSSKKSSSFGKYIPIEVLIDILLQQKIAENEKLKKRIKELEALLEMYNTLELTDDQKRKLQGMKEALGVSGDDLESTATSSFFSDYDTDIDDVTGVEGGLPGTGRDTDKESTIGGVTSRYTDKESTIGGVASRDTDKESTIGGVASRDTDKESTIAAAYYTDKEGTIEEELESMTGGKEKLLRTASELDKESASGGTQSSKAKAESPETKIVFTKIPESSGESSRVSFASPGTSSVTDGTLKVCGSLKKTPGSPTTIPESSQSEIPCPFKEPCETCKFISPSKDDNDIHTSTSGSPIKDPESPSSYKQPSQTSENIISQSKDDNDIQTSMSGSSRKVPGSPCPYKQPCEACKKFISPSKDNNDTQTTSGSPCEDCKKIISSSKDNNETKLCGGPIKHSESVASTNYSTSSEDFTTLIKESESPEIPRIVESPPAIFASPSQPETPSNIPESPLNIPESIRSTGSPHSFDIPYESCAKTISSSRVSESSTRMIESPAIIPESPSSVPESPSSVPESPSSVPESPSSAPEIPSSAPEIPSSAPGSPISESHVAEYNMQINELQNMLIKKDEEIAMLQDNLLKLSSLITDNEDLTQLLIQTQLALDSAQNEKAQLAKNVASTKPQDIFTLEAEIETIRDKGNLTPDQETEVIKKELTVLKKYCDNLSNIQEENEELKSECIRLQRELEEALRGKDDKEKVALQKKCADYAEQIKTLQNKLQSSVTDLLKSDEIKDLQIRSDLLNDVLNEREELRKQLKKIEDLRRQSSQNVDFLEQENKDLIDELNELKQDRKQEADMCATEITKYKLQINEQSNELFSLKCEKNKLNKVLETIQRERDELRNQLAFMEREFKEQDDEMDELREKIQEAELLKLERDRLHLRLEELLTLEVEVLTLVEQIKNLSIERDMYKKQIGELDCVICDQEDEIKQLLYHIDRLSQNVDKQQEKLNKVIKDYQNELDERNCMLKNVENKLEKLNKAIGEYQNKLNEKNCMLESVEKQREELKKVLKDIQKELDEKNCLLCCGEKERESLRKVIKDIQKELDEKNCMLCSGEEERESLRKEIKHIQKELNEKNCMLCCGEEERESLRKIIEDIQTEMIEKNCMLANVEKQREKLKEVIEDYQNELDQKNCMLACVEKQREKLREVMDEFQRELDEKNCMLACSTEELAQLKCIERAMEQREAELMQRENELLRTIREIQKTVDDKEDLLNTMTCKGNQDFGRKMSSDLLKARKENEKLQEIVYKLQQHCQCNHIDIMLEESKYAVDVVINEVKSFYGGKKRPPSGKYYDDNLYDENEQLRKNSMEMQNLARGRIDELTQQLQKSTKENAELRAENDILQSMNKGIETALNMLNNQLEENVSSSVDNECPCENLDENPNLEAELIELRKKCEETVEAFCQVDNITCPFDDKISSTEVKKQLEECLCKIADSKNKLTEVHKTEEVPIQLKKTISSCSAKNQLNSLKNELNEIRKKYEESVEELMQARSQKDENDKLKKQIRECLCENSDRKNEVIELRKKYDDIIEEQIQAQMQKDSIHDQLEEKICTCTNNEDLRKLLNECLGENADLKYECFNLRTKYENAVNEQKQASSQKDAINNQLEQQILSSNAAHKELEKLLNECLCEKANVENELFEMRMKYEETIKNQVQASAQKDAVDKAVGTQPSEQKVEVSISTVESVASSKVVSFMEPSSKTVSSAEPSSKAVSSSEASSKAVSSSEASSKAVSSSETSSKVVSFREPPSKVQEQQSIAEESFADSSILDRSTKDPSTAEPSEDFSSFEQKYEIESIIRKSIEEENEELKIELAETSAIVQKLSQEMEEVPQETMELISSISYQFKEENDVLKTENAALKEEITQLEEELQKITAILDRQGQEQIEALKNELQAYAEGSQHALTDTECGLENLKNLNKELEKQIEYLKNEIDRLANLITDGMSPAALNELKVVNKQQQEEIECLKSYLKNNVSPEMQKENNSFKEEIENLKELVRQQEKEIEDFKAKCKCLAFKLQDSQMSITSADITDERVKSLISKLKNDILDLECENNCLRMCITATNPEDEKSSFKELDVFTKNKRLEAELKDLKDELECMRTCAAVAGTIDDLEAKLKALQDKNKKSEAKLKALQDTYKALQNTYKDLKDKYDETLSERAKLQEQLCIELCKLRAMVEQLQNENKSLADKLRVTTSSGDDQINSLLAKLKELQAEMEDSKTRMEKMKADQKELLDRLEQTVKRGATAESDLENEIKKLKSKICELEGVIKQQQSTINQLRGGGDDIRIKELEAKLKQIEAEKAHLESRIGQMQQEQDELTNQMNQKMQRDIKQESELESEVIKLRSKVKELETLIKDLENQIKDCKVKLADSVDKQKLADLEKKLANMTAEKNDVTKEKDNFVAEVFNLKSKIDSLLKELAALQGDTDVLRNTLKDLDVYKKELDELKKYLDTLRKELDKVKAENNQDKALIESLRKENAGHKKDLKDLTDKLQLGPGPDEREEKNRLNELIKKLEKQLKDCEASDAAGNLADELKKLKAQYDQLKEDHAKEKAAMQAQYDQNLALAKEQYERDLKYVRGRHSDGIVRLQNVHEDTVNETIKNYEREIENLQKQLAEASKKLKAAQESLNAKENEVNNLQKQLQSAQDALKYNDDEIVKLKKDLEIEKNKSSELDKQLEDEKKKNATFDSELAKLKKDFENEKSKNAELSTALDIEKTKAANALKSLEDEKKKTAEFDSELAKMKNDLESEKSKNSDLAKSLQDEMSKNSNASDELAKLMKDLENEQNKNAQLQNDIENEKSRVADATKALENANNSNSSTADELSKAQKDIENEKSKNAQLAKDIENKNDEIAQMKNELSDKDSEISKLKQLLADKDSEINQLKKDLEQVGILKSELDAEKNKSNELANKLQASVEAEKGQGDATEQFKKDLEATQKKLADSDAELAKLRQDLENEIKRVDKAIEEEKRKCAAKDDEIAKLKSNVAAKDDELNKLRKELENEKKKNADCIEALQNERKRVSMLKGDLEAFKKELNIEKQRTLDAHKALEEEKERNKDAIRALHAENMEKMNMMTRPSTNEQSQTECPTQCANVGTDKCICADNFAQTDKSTCVAGCAQTDVCPCVATWAQTDKSACVPGCVQTDNSSCVAGCAQTDECFCIATWAQTDDCPCVRTAVSAQTEDICPCGALIAQRKVDKLSKATALIVEIKEKKLFLSRKTIVMTNLPPASDGTVTSDDYGRQIISVEEERPINLTKSIENVLAKALKSGLENLTFEELKDLHTKTTNAANIINQPLEGSYTDPFDKQLMEQPKVSLMRRIATLENELGVKHKAALEKMSILDRTLQIEKQRLNEMKKALLSERKRNNDLIQRIGMQTRENANIEVERDLLKRQTSYHEDRLQKLIVTIEEEKAERRKLEEELSKGKNTERTLKTLLETEKERANSIKIKANDTVNLLRIRLEKALDTESQLKMQLGPNAMGRIQRSRGPNSITDSRSPSPTPATPGRRQSPTPRSCENCVCRHRN